METNIDEAKILDIANIPKPRRLARTGKRQYIWRSIFRTVRALPKGKALEVVHNCGSAQEFTGKAFTAAKAENPPISIVVHLRGKFAYIHLGE